MKHFGQQTGDDVPKRNTLVVNAFRVLQQFENFKMIVHCRVKQRGIRGHPNKTDLLIETFSIGTIFHTIAPM